MRLALEGLGVVQPQRTIVDALIDQIQLIEAEDALRDSLEEVDVLLHTYHSLESIHQAIKQCGVTQSIVHLYGENFSSMENDQTDGAEKEVEEKKQGVLGRAWEAIKNMFRKFWAWVMSLFDPMAKMQKKLKAVESKVDEVKYPISSHGILVPHEMTMIHNILANSFKSYMNSEVTDIARDFDLIKRVLDECKDDSVEIKSASAMKNAIISHINFCTEFSKLKTRIQKEIDRLTARNQELRSSNQQIDPAQFGRVVEHMKMCKQVIQTAIQSSRNLIALFN